jgi:hypothetical protein
MLTALITIVFVVIALGALLHALAGPHPPAMPPRSGFPGRRGESLFVSAKWPRRVGGTATTGYNRPPDVGLEEQGILPPPREVEGRNGE